MLIVSAKELYRFWKLENMEWIGRSLSLPVEQMEEGSSDVGNNYKAPKTR